MIRIGIGSLLTLLSLVAAAPGVAEDGGVLYPTRYYPGVADSSLATPITVAAGQTWLGVDILMDAAGGTLRGTLTLQAGEGLSPEPLDGVLVEALCRGRRVVTRTGADGRFRLSGVPSGVAIVRYSTDDARTRDTRARAVFHPGVTDLERAARIAVADGEEEELGSVVLHPGVRLGGVVRTADGGAPMAGVEVRIRSVTQALFEDRAEGAPGDSAWSFPGDGGVWVEHTRADGRFLQGGLPPGTYTVFADAYGTDQISEYLGGSREPEGAAVLTLSGGEERLDLAIDLDRGGAIGGEVREDGTAEPLADLEVQVIEESGGGIYRGVSGPFGGYRVGGLPSGRYLVFVPGIRKYYPNERRREDARVLAVTEPLEVLGVNLKGFLLGECMLAPPSQGTIVGYVSADFTDVRRAVVRAWSATDTLESPISLPGFYAVTCLRPGSYRVAFLADGPLRAQYHKKTNDLAQATFVSVTAADSTEGIDFLPERAIRIEGRVRGGLSGAGLEGVLVRAVETRRGVRAETRTDASSAFVLDRLGAVDASDIRTGLPAGSWRVAAETTLVEDPILTPILQPEIRARLDGTLRVRVEWELPPGPTWSYEVFRDDSYAPTLIESADSVSVTGGPFVHFDQPPSPGRFRYRLTAWLVNPGDPPEPPFRAASEWVDVDRVEYPPAGGRWRVRARPVPWNGRGTLRLILEGVGDSPGASPAAEAARRIRILDSSGRTVALCPPEPGSEVFLWDGRDGRGRPAASGLYLLRSEVFDSRRSSSGNGASGMLLLVR